MKSCEIMIVVSAVMDRTQRTEKYGLMLIK